MSEASLSLFERVGGSAYFEALVDRFYDGVATDPVLRPLYPEGDLSDERRWLALFLVQYWGGPGTYSSLRGHPRLRVAIEQDGRRIMLDAAIEHAFGAVHERYHVV